MTGYESNARSEVYRYDALHNQLICVSCDASNAEAQGDATLAPDGLSLTNDGRVFFTTPDSLASRDNDEKQDVYEWEEQGFGNCKATGGCVSLISAGTSPFDSRLLSASANGTDVYFFTRDTLAPQDENGPAIKIYDARENGGFFVIPPRQPCQASDECHGPSSPTPPPPVIRTVAGSRGNSAPQKGSGRHRGKAIIATTVTGNTTATRPIASMDERLRMVKEKFTMSTRRVPTENLMSHRILAAMVALIFGLIATALLTATAQASEGIESFATSSSTSQAGAHPDLQTSFKLREPGVSEVAQNVIFNAPQGVFGNPNAVTRCTTNDFDLAQCPSSSQVGLITVYANYEGDPEYLLGTVPIYDVVPAASQTALFAFIAPILNIPIDIPVAVRTAGDYGLRFTVQGIPQLMPLSTADMTFWGFPAQESHDAQRFPKGSLTDPAGCAGAAGTTCLTHPTPAGIAAHPLTDNPTSCSGQDLVTTLGVQTYQDPEGLSESKSSYPAITGCEKQTFAPVLYASPTTEQTDSASGLDVELNDPQPLGFAVTPSAIRSAIVTLPPGLTINPDAADGQSDCTEAQANFGSEGPGDCPDNAKIGTFSIGTPALDGRLDGSVYIGEPKPGDQYRLFMMASGFGINAKLIGSVKPNPETGQVTVHIENLPQVPFDDFQLHLFSGERALMATPIACTVYTVSADFSPWDTVLPEQQSSQVFGLESGPHGSQCPGQIRPFNPSLVAGTSNSVAGAFSSFTLKLDREDGDQYLGKLNFTMPPGLSANLHGITYCPEADIAAAAQTPGRTEQADPSCPSSSEIGSSNVAAGPGSHPFHAVGKIYLAGPFKGRPPEPSRDHPRPRRAL